MADLTKTGTQLAVGLLVVGVLFAFLLPVAIDPIAGDRTDTLTQTEDTTYALTGIVDVNATDINNTSSPKTVKVKLTNTDDGASVTTGDIGEGNNETVTLSGSEITVENVNVSDSTTAEIKYTYPETTGWDSGSKAIYGLLPVFFILVAVLYVVRQTT